MRKLMGLKEKEIYKYIYAINNRFFYIKEYYVFRYYNNIIYKFY